MPSKKTTSKKTTKKTQGAIEVGGRKVKVRDTKKAEELVAKKKFESGTTPEQDKAADELGRRLRNPKEKRGLKAIREEKAAEGGDEHLCVFAFRLTEEERDAIHKAAGPAKASKFVRSLAVAAARDDEATVKAIMKAVQATA